MFKRKNYQDIIVESKKIIGIMGNYEEFIYSLNDNVFLVKKDSYFIKDNVYDELNYYIKSDFDEVVNNYFDIFSLDRSLLKRKIKDLSSSEKRILKYIEALISNKKIIVIDNAYLYLDLCNKKKIDNVLKKMIRESDKTIFIGSNNSDDIYNLCDRLLLINGNKYYYGKTIDIFTSDELLQEYGIIKPEIIHFVDLCRRKDKKINYTCDIRDLIKEVYKNV